MRLFVRVNWLVERDAFNIMKDHHGVANPYAAQKLLSCVV